MSRLNMLTPHDALMDRMYGHSAAMQVNQQLYLNLVHGWLSGHLLATIKDGVYSQNKPQLFTVALGEMFTHYEDRAFQRKRACIDWWTKPDKLVKLGDKPEKFLREWQRNSDELVMCGVTMLDIKTNRFIECIQDQLHDLPGKLRRDIIACAILDFSCEFLNVI